MLSWYPQVILSGLIVCLLPSFGACAQFTPLIDDDDAERIARLKPLATEVMTAIEAGNVDEAMSAADRLNDQVSEILREKYSPKKVFLSLEKKIESEPRAIRTSFLAALAYYAERAGEYDKARVYALEAIEFADREKSLRAGTLYYANEVLGLLALRQNDIQSATRHLIASLANGGWPRLADRGPDVTLAKALLDKGEVEPVVEFFEKFKPLWPSGEKQLTIWQAVIRSGAKPDLSRYLAVHPPIGEIVRPAKTDLHR